MNLILGARHVHSHDLVLARLVLRDIRDVHCWRPLRALRRRILDDQRYMDTLDAWKLVLQILRIVDRRLWLLMPHALTAAGLVHFVSLTPLVDLMLFMGIHGRPSCCRDGLIVHSAESELRNVDDG